MVTIGCCHSAGDLRAVTTSRCHSAGDLRAVTVDRRTGPPARQHPPCAVTPPPPRSSTTHQSEMRFPLTTFRCALLPANLKELGTVAEVKNALTSCYSWQHVAWARIGCSCACLTTRTPTIDGGPVHPGYMESSSPQPAQPVFDILAWGNAFPVVFDVPPPIFFWGINATARRNTRAAN